MNRVCRKICDKKYRPKFRDDYHHSDKLSESFMPSIVNRGHETFSVLYSWDTIHSCDAKNVRSLRITSKWQRFGPISSFNVAPIYDHSHKMQVP